MSAAEGGAEDFAIVRPQHAATGRIVLGGVVAAVLGPALSTRHASEEEVSVVSQVGI